MASGYLNDVIFDSEGNAWVFTGDYFAGDYVTKYDAQTDTWLDREILSPFPAGSTPIGYGAAAAIDSEDNIALLYALLNNTNRYVMVYVRNYQPGEGWNTSIISVQTAERAYPMVSINVVSDSLGNMVESHMYGGVLYSSSSAAESHGSYWDHATEIVPSETEVAVAPRIIQNQSRTATYLVYMATSNSHEEPFQLYAHRFDSNNVAWNEAEVLPDASDCTFLLGEEQAFLRGVVDEDGEATVFWEKKLDETTWLCASRTAEGVWRSPEYLLQMDMPSGMECFGDATVNAAGDVTLLTPVFINTAYQLCSLAYKHGEGWQTPEFLGVSFDTSGMVRLSTLGDSSIVATLNTDEMEFGSLRFDGAEWDEEVDVLSEDWYGQTTIIRASDGKRLAVYELRGDRFEDQGIWARWLELRCDIDGDGDVDLSDLAGLLAAYGSSEGDPDYLADADFDGNGTIGLADLAELLGSYGKTL